jgi:hypothetical protein
MMKKKRFTRYFPKCKIAKKTSYPTQLLARRGMMHIISHDPSTNMFDLHTYQCEHKVPNVHWHIGHKSYFEKKVQQEQNQQIGA